MIKIYDHKISAEELRLFLGKPYEEMIKFVVDVRLFKIALGGELHSDAEEALLQNGSKQEDLWGGNIYPDLPKEAYIRYTSMINIRPSQGHKAMEIKDPKIISRIDQVLSRTLP